MGETRAFELMGEKNEILLNALEFSLFLYTATDLLVLALFISDMQVKM
jgi:hypothetical protein